MTRCALMLFFIMATAYLSAQIDKNCLIDQDTSQTTTYMSNAKNVLGSDLQSCCFDPLTGYFRDGFCRTREDDYGTHVVCARMTEEFLTYTKAKGNDLSAPLPAYNFPGLKQGDQWCLCVSRWKEAMLNGVAPSVILESTHENALEIVTLEELREYQIK